nr:photosystem II protein Y [Fibrocapsa japonica]UTE95105.1 photosystem II protein Y [Fibrocapsa japonica]
MDARLFIVIVPLLTAASWALYNIGRVALQQFMRMTTR